MKKPSNLLAGTLLSGLLLAVLATSGSVTAASPPKGISLTPFEQQLTLGSTDGAKSFDIILTNHTDSLQELDLSSRDFGSLNDSGGILLEGHTAYSQRYGLTSWLTLGTDTVVLQPGESRTIPVTVDNRSSLQPGGHYAAVVASVNSLNNQAGNHVVINQQLLSLVLVDKVGGEHFDLKLAGITQNGNWLHLPTTVKLHFQNPGNVHVIPRGTVKLLTPSGTVVSQGIINDDSSFVLPETFRDIYVNLTPVGRALSLPGLYRLEVQYHYDGLNKTASRDFRLRYIDLKLYVVLLVIAGSGWWLFRRLKSVSSSPKS